MGAKYTKQIFACEHCGKEFVTYYAARRKFCCRACQTAATAKRHECTCQSCGQTFVRGSATRGRYCSYDCYWQSLQGQKPTNYDPVTLQCVVCGKPFDVSRGRVGKAQYCSYACAGKAREKERITKTCPTCGKVFTVWPSKDNVRYCSHECHGKDNRGERNATWKGGRFPYYGGNWAEQCKAARERDGYRCQVCGIPERKLTYRLHVHHIIPRRKFGNDFTRANDLSNLVCLCRSCHKQVEHKTVPLQPKLV